MIQSPQFATNPCEAKEMPVNYSLLTLRLVLVLVFLLTPRLSLGKESSCRNAEEIAENEQAMLLDGTMEGQQRLVSCIQEAWVFFEGEEQVKNTDFVNTASNNLLSALKFNPISFTKIMDQHPWLLNRWLKNIEFDIFTWREDSPCGYNPQISYIRSLMRIVGKVEGSSYSFKRIRARFSNMRCNQID